MRKTVHTGVVAASGKASRGKRRADAAISPKSQTVDGADSFQWRCLSSGINSRSGWSDPGEVAALAVKPADSVQFGGDFYKTMAVQPWTALESWLTPEQLTGYHLGQAIAYLARFNTQGAAEKGGRQDLLKAQHYLDKLLELTPE